MASARGENGKLLQEPGIAKFLGYQRHRNLWSRQNTQDARMKKMDNKLGENSPKIKILVMTDIAFFSCLI